MRNILLSAIATSLILLSSCSTPYFTTVNNMREISGTIYLNDGREINGPISNSLSTYYTSNSYISMTEADSKKSKKIYVSEIKGINVRNTYYEPKRIDMGWGSDRVLFLRRLSKENSRIGLFELYEQHTNSSTNRRGYSSTYTTDDYSYYITLEGHPAMEAWSLGGKHLTPNFEDKMSELVKDCPVLADKIHRKEKGYFYAQVSLVEEKRIETMMNIIEAYNRCR
ncbi:hypothetical protein BH11BAC4_BH11BAC4_10940 [soil metagenome]